MRLAFPAGSRPHSCADGDRRPLIDVNPPQAEALQNCSAKRTIHAGQSSFSSMLTVPASRSAATHADAAGRLGIRLPRSLVGLIREVSGWHQVGLACITTVVFLLNAAPLEMQRRIVNNALHGGDLRAIVLLAAAYAGVAMAEGLIKLAMNVYRGWVSENAVRWLRMIVLDIRSRDGIAATDRDDGLEISIILAETEPIGGFVGVSVSEPLMQGGVLVTVLAYMVYLQPLMALVSLCIFAPQMAVVPIMQAAINRKVAARILVLRAMSTAIASHDTAEPDGKHRQQARTEEVFGLNMGVYKLKFSLNFIMNASYHLGIAAIFVLGGYYVVTGRTEVGTIVAFTSGLARINDPWGDLVTWFRDLKVTQTKYDLIGQAMRGGGAGGRV